MQFEHLFFEGTTSIPVQQITRSHRATAERPPGAGPEEVGGFMGELLVQARLPAGCYRGPALSRRAAACLRFLGAATPDEATRRIGSNPALVQSVLSVALLGVTEFFRDRPVFDHLGGTVLPALRAAHSPLRVWSAACSAGHELYSVAMLLAESDRLADCELVGTDCRAEAIDQAQSGAFESEAIANLEPRRRERFFAQVRGSTFVNAELRWATKWRQADLLSEVELGPWHLILWRNMAIYLECSAAAGIWRRLTDQLSPGGYIVCGKADHPPVDLPLVRVARCFYQRVPSK